MPDLPHSIELHDSLMTSMETRSGVLCITLGPAYVHNHGKGWLQEAKLIIDGVTVESSNPALPARLSDGTLKTFRGLYHNLLPLPLHDLGPISLEIKFESGATLRAQGGSAEIRLLGEPRFLENFG
jgi:hypothetical protein